MGDWTTAHEAVAEALHITQHDRNDKAGAAEDNFRRIGGVWSNLLDTKLSEPIDAADVARMMIGMKIVRDAHAPHRDNRVDTIGYALCLERAQPTEAPPLPYDFTLDATPRGVSLTKVGDAKQTAKGAAAASTITWTEFKSLTDTGEHITQDDLLQHMWYLAGPYRGERISIPRKVEDNVEDAIAAWNFLADHSVDVVCPHATTYELGRRNPRSDRFWLDYTMKLLLMCTGLIVLPGWHRSEGTRAEIAEAAGRGIPIVMYSDVVSLLNTERTLIPRMRPYMHEGIPSHWLLGTGAPPQEGTFIRPDDQG